jgi:hypothetical protein
MAEITISLQEDKAEALRGLATRLGLRPEDLARAGLEDLLARPDEAVGQVFDQVISKNRELYRRLA